MRIRPAQDGDSAVATVLERLKAAGRIEQLEPLTTTHRRRSVIVKATATISGQPKVVAIKIARPSDLSTEAWRRTRDEVTRSFELLHRFRAAFEPFSDCSVVSPIACYPELLTQVTEYQDGRRLSEVLREEAKLLPTTDKLAVAKEGCFAVGRWLKRMQEITRIDGQRVDVNALVHDIDVRLQNVGRWV